VCNVVVLCVCVCVEEGVWDGCDVTSGGTVGGVVCDTDVRDGTDQRGEGCAGLRVYTFIQRTQVYCRHKVSTFISVIKFLHLSVMLIHLSFIEFVHLSVMLIHLSVSLK